MPGFSFLNDEFEASFFTFPFHPYQEALKFLFVFCCKSGIICISEVVVISPSNLASTCESFSLAFGMMYSACDRQGDNIQLCCTSFPILNQSVVPCKVLTVAS